MERGLRGGGAEGGRTRIERQGCSASQFICIHGAGEHAPGLHAAQRWHVPHGATAQHPAALLVGRR
eukprot:5864023-Prymnesium_polylepis.1